MRLLRQAHFFTLPNQGNIYSFTELNLANNTNKLLIASLKRPIHCFEYIENAAGVLVPSAKEVSFTYIPSGADIISMDAFNKSSDKNDFVIGITIMKNVLDKNDREAYLNIYSAWEESHEFNIESIAQNCLNVPLNFIPYQLTHTVIAQNERVILITGNDKQVHVYKEHYLNHTYKEVEGKSIFPEFKKLPSVVLYLDMQNYEKGTKRVSAIGCECGYLRLMASFVETGRVIFHLSTRFVSPVTQVKIYTDKETIKPPSFVGVWGKPELREIVDEVEEEEVFNLAIVNAILPSAVFRDITKKGLDNYSILTRTELISVQTCLMVGDINLDGKKEILIGSSASDMKVYNIHTKEAKLKQVKSLISPVVGMKYMDIIGDGVKEVVIFTTKGMYIYQHKGVIVQKKLEENAETLAIPDIATLKI